jgi:hypothetical protein
MVNLILGQGPDLPASEVLKERKALGFGRHPETGAAVQARLREAGLAPAIVVFAGDEAGGARLIQELDDAAYDGVVIGSFTSGLDPEFPPTAQAARWFRRLLNVTRAHAPAAVLVRSPQ